MSNFWGRKVEFITGNRTITNDLDIEFDIPFDDGPEINIAEVKIYNLSSDTIHDIKKGADSTVNAGYSGDIGVILTGTIKSVKTAWEGVDKVTTVTIADSNDNWLNKNFNKTYKKDITAKQILTDLIKASGLKLGKLSLPTNKIYKGGKTVKDKIGKAIADIVPDCNAKLHVTRKTIYISGRDEGTETNIVIDKDSGLIETPEWFEKEEQYKVNKTVVSNVKKGSKTVKKIETKEENKTRTLSGYKVKMLLNYRVKTDAIIRINSKTANGKFRVGNGTHNGSEFITEVEVYPL
jgi:hypothetical protein